MKARRTVLARIAVLVLLAASLVAVLPGPAHAAVLKPRRCADPIITGDGVRYLSVCARGWVDDANEVTRSVVEMHTYKWIGGGTQKWVDSTSQSITMEFAQLHCCGPDAGGGWELVQSWGQWYSGNGPKCRVNGPAGTPSCSVPNTYRVAFYGPAFSPSSLISFRTAVTYVSWRDDRGIAHRDVPVKDPATNQTPLYSPTWYG
jgi:hypothetical protein